MPSKTPLLALLALSTFALACGPSAGSDAGTGGQSDAGLVLQADGGWTRADGGTVDAGPPVDAGCPEMELIDGGCIALAFTRVCDVSSVTVLQSGVLADDAAAVRMGQSLSVCLPPPTVTTVDTRNGGGGLLATNGQPLPGRSETFLAAGGSFGQPFVNWFEASGRSPVYDSSTATLASLSNAGSVIFSEPVANLGASLDYFALEFVRSAPTGPLSVIGYGFYAPGTAAAAWYFEHRVMAQRATFTASWYVVRWNDVDGDHLPGEADQFTLLRSGS
jgi:hypothetical protein